MAGGPVRRGALMSEINVTPFVDVMLVLLVIFMVTAPLLTEQLRVELPKEKAQIQDQNKDSITLTIDKEGRYYLPNGEVTAEELDASLKKIFQMRDDKTIYLYADKDVAYGAVVKAMAIMQPLGLRLGVMTEPPPAKRAR